MIAIIHQLSSTDTTSLWCNKKIPHVKAWGIFHFTESAQAKIRLPPFLFSYLWLQ